MSLAAAQQCKPEGWRTEETLEWHVRRIAIDTSDHAHELVALYKRRSYEIIDSISWPVTNYGSEVLAQEF